MYIALTKKNGKASYELRCTCEVDDQLTHTVLFNLGDDPSKFIVYPGGNAYYFDESIDEVLSESNIDYDSDQLDLLFWPWLDPEIKYAVQSFRDRGDSKTGTNRDHFTARTIIQAFDKRRTHFLKFGTMEQGPVENMPTALFKGLDIQSRDEIEQTFMSQERVLKAHELKSYVYTAFDLQSFFSSYMAAKMPHVLDQKKVETLFLKELCRLNALLFDKTDELDQYMRRYMIMFFDYQYADTTLLDDLAKDFMDRHRFHKPQKPANIPLRNALKVFRLTKKAFKVMSEKALNQYYRKLARTCHPDSGGSHDAFVELNNAYESLLSRKKGKQ
jgi:hypothetical protein